MVETDPRRVALLSAEIADLRDVVGGLYDVLCGMLEAAVAHGAVNREGLDRVLASALDWQARAEREQPDASVNWAARRAPLLALRDHVASLNAPQASAPRPRDPWRGLVLIVPGKDRAP